MDRRIVAEKLESLRRCSHRIKEKTPQLRETFLADLDLQDIIVLNLSRAIQLCVDIAAHLVAVSQEKPPATMGEIFDALLRMQVIDSRIAIRMKKEVGFRNIAVHGYQEIDFAIVYSLITNHLDDFSDFAKAITRYTAIDEP